MIGLDTGFFVEFLRANSHAVAVWESLIENNEEAVVSCLTLFELERLGLKKAIEGAETLLEAIPAVCTVLWIQEPDTLAKAAALSHGSGHTCGGLPDSRRFSDFDGSNYLYD